MRTFILIAFAFCSLLAGCPGPQNVACLDDRNCNRFPGGSCTSAPSGNQWCAYPDPSCSSGQRYSDLDVGDGLAGMCVAEDVDAGIDAVTIDAPPPPEMITIPGGVFLRGCNDAVEDCTSGSRADSLPAKSITISTFLIDSTEVTQFSYKQCIDAGQCAQPSVGFDPVTLANHPVTNVTWQQAVDYCAFKGKRLPTEAEWEKASRGTDGREHPWGNFDPTCYLAHYLTCSPESTLPVVSRSGDSPFGVKDMAGNVSEWVSDWYSNTYYYSNEPTDPQGPATGSSKVYRGGDFASGIAFVRSAMRRFSQPVFSSKFIGFRCAKN